MPQHISMQLPFSMPWHATPLRVLTAVAVAVAFSACADTGDGPPEDGVSLHIKALASCGESNPKNPFADIGSLEIVVHDDAGKEVMRKKNQFKGTQKRLDFTGVPAGPGRTITLIGYAHGGGQSWFARRRGVKVVKNTSTELDMSLVKLEGFTCLGKEGGAGIPNVAFANLTQIDNGRVLVTGGFAVAEKDGSNKRVTSARDDAYIYDPNTGQLRDPAKKGRMKAARAGHKAIFLPKRNSVLVVGGASEMSVPGDGSGPPTWKVTSGVNVAFELLDLAKDDQGNSKEEFLMPSTTDYIDKLMLPNLMPLADDYVVALGGAEWPASKATNKISYRRCDLFKPDEGTYGTFINVAGALPLNAVRAGAAISFIDTTEEGGSRFLIWGGQDGSTKAEIFREDTQPGNGFFDANYKVSGDINGKDVPGSLHFATLTPLGAGTDDQGRFLSVGGVRFSGGKWQAPSPKDVYLVTLIDKPGAAKEIKTKRIAGFPYGTYMHQASLTDDKHVLISGGFTSYSKPTNASLVVYDIATNTFSQPAAAKTFVKRGAHAAQRLNNDCVLMWGGVSSWKDLESTTQVVADIYCPGHLAQ